jgi:hypothetical protein
MSSLGTSVRGSLACLPADPLLWLVPFWHESARNGFKPQSIAYLRLSYRLGPNHGWVIWRRSHIAFAVFERSPPDLAEQVTNEFVTLVESGFYREALKILTVPAWQLRDVIAQFAKLLYFSGYDVAMPGADPPELRPWH